MTVSSKVKVVTSNDIPNDLKTSKDHKTLEGPKKSNILLTPRIDIWIISRFLIKNFYSLQHFLS